MATSILGLETFATSEYVADAPAKLNSNYELIDKLGSMYVTSRLTYSSGWQSITFSDDTVIYWGTFDLGTLSSLSTAPLGTVTVDDTELTVTEKIYGKQVNLPKSLTDITYIGATVMQDNTIAAHVAHVAANKASSSSSAKYSSVSLYFGGLDNGHTATYRILIIGEA